jgi:hypothetical protein
VSLSTYHNRFQKSTHLVQVDAVDEDVTLDNLLVGSRLLAGLLDIPLGNVLLRDTGAAAHLDGAGAAAAKGANDEHARQLAGLGLALGDALLDGGQEVGLVGVALDGRQELAGVVQLPRPVLQGEGRAGEAGAPAEGSNADEAAGGDLLLEELEVEERAAATSVAGENVLPAALVLEAVVESNVDVLEGDC